ncbi:glycerol-3-phosphate dehydrogenase [Stackebrandtia endophytica]|uniref:Glycerol-3-phosphate dehydrogenase n=1 Tax=Stackebrandtia endophytica TaxID=1496996 RepID=A0A543AV88_9ACTN|nr:glycerol-3-phosphate dehydrogenase/oxidase [Stackebrandtia endophytica]TQL76474.1 glycerol-3-phosphate dehydrogenase [Stackebrandtia endophytica]
MNTALNRDRRSTELAGLSSRGACDLLVIGGGVTGVGIALDAASRGLSVVLAERHDLAFGTSRWSSKLVHGGLRYLATGDVAVAYESAVERGILMRHTAPHLIRPLPQIVPLLSTMGTSTVALVRTGYLAGDLLRMAAGTPSRLLPRSRRLSAAQVRQHAPTVAATGLRGGLAFWDGQLVDDARLVTAIARTAAGYGATILTRCTASEVTGTGAVLTDELTGQRHTVDAKAVVNATGVWASRVAPDVTLRPSRGSHLVFPQSAFGGLTAGLTVPVPGARNRFVFALPTKDRVYVGLTDEDTDGDVPDVPTASEAEIDFLIDTINTALAHPVGRDNLLGSYAGLRPLLATDSDETADISRRHAVITGEDGLITIVGGKLTTYRRMAQAAVDTAIKRAGLNPLRRCQTRRLALVGAADRDELAALAHREPLLGHPHAARLVRRYGSEAAAVASDPTLLEPITPGLDTTWAELRFAITHEGALDEADLLDRRTRIGLSHADRAAAHPAAEEALARWLCRGAVLTRDRLPCHRRTKRRLVGHQCSASFPACSPRRRLSARGELMAQEAIALMLDVPTRRITVELEAKVPGAEAVLRDLSMARKRRAEAVEREATDLARAARRLTAMMTVRDAGKVLGMSYQRVSQLTGSPSASKRSGRNAATA